MPYDGGIMNNLKCMIICVIAMIVVSIVHVIYVVAKIAPIFLAFFGISYAILTAYAHLNMFTMDIFETSMIISGLSMGIWILLNDHELVNEPADKTWMRRNRR